jgi:hypothetical protein
MICAICKRNEAMIGQFCQQCIDAVKRIDLKTVTGKPQKLYGTNVSKVKPTSIHDNKITHYRVQVKGFCSYVDVRDCPHMDEAPNYALDPHNREPWYPTTKKSPLSPEIPFVEPATHGKFCDWLKEKEI